MSKLFCALSLLFVTASLANPTAAEAGRFTSPADHSEVYQSDVFSRAGMYWYADEFEKLEEMAAEFLATGIRTPDGNLKLDLFYRTLGRIFSIEDNVGAIHDPHLLQSWVTFERWKQKIPNSRIIPIIEAIKVRQWAVDPRVAVSYLPTSGVEPQRRAIKEALKQLERALDPATGGDPHAWVLKGDLECILGAQEEEILLFTDEAARRHPTYYPIFNSIMVCLTYRSEREFADQTLYANTVVTSLRHRGADDDEFYARMYLAVAQSGYGDRLHTETALQWPKFRSGLKKIAEQFPTQWNREQFALHACLAGDRATTRKYIKAATDKPTRVIWGNLKKLEDCEDWAK